MAAGSVEATLELWASSLRASRSGSGPLFRQDRTAAAAGLFLDALLGPERRKTGWMRAEAAGDPGPWRQQALLDRSRWEADALRDLVRDDALETLAEPDAVLVIDETGFLKQGQASCGVGAPVHGLGGQDHQLPDRGVRGLRVAARGTPSSTARSTCPRPGPTTRPAWRPRMCRRNRLRHQASAGAGDDRAGACGRRAVPLGGRGHRVWGGEVEIRLSRAGKGYVLGVSGAHPFNSL